MRQDRRDRIAAAFDRELARTPLPPGLRAQAVRATLGNRNELAPQRQPWVVALVAGLLAVAIVATIVLGTRALTSSSPVARPVASPSPVSAADLQSGHWSTLPPAPIEPRDGASIVWTGRELLVWGGYIYPSITALGDGAAYDPTTRRWRKLPDSPLSPRVSQVAVWTGSEMVVWGGGGYSGAAGAAYNPISNTWRLLPQGPLSARGGAVGVWTGTEVFLLGGLYGAGQNYTDGAAFDPRSGTWRAIAPPTPPVGHPLAWKAAVYIDGQVLAWSEWETTRRISSSTTDFSGGVDLFSYSLETNSWRLVPSSSSALPDVEQVLVANQLVVVRGEPISCSVSCPFLAEATTIYDPVTMAWSRLPPDPLAAEYLSSAWTGGALFSYNSDDTVGNIHPGNASAYDPAEHQWAGLPIAPFGCATYPATALWTGRAVLLYCSQPLPAPTAISGLEFEVP